MGFSVAAVGSEESKPFDKAGIPYYRYDLQRGISPFNDKRSINQLIELFSQIQPDVVHAFDTKPAVLVPRAASHSGIKGCVRTVTGMGYVFSSLSPIALSLRPIYRFMQRGASGLADVTIFQNEDDQRYFEKTGLVESGKSVLVRGSGVDLDLLEKQKASDVDVKRLRQAMGLEDSLVITMVSRLVRQKGILEFLVAARRVRQLLPESRFLLVGPQADEGRQAVSLETIESYKDCVDWIGPRSDVPAILSLSDIFVLPSYYREGVPRVLLEAGAMGLPLVTTDMPGCRDVVKNGVTGLLVPPWNCELLSDAIFKLANSAALRRELGNNARDHIAESFSLEKVAHDYEKIYQKILACESCVMN